MIRIPTAIGQGQGKTIQCWEAVFWLLNSVSRAPSAVYGSELVGLHRNRKPRWGTTMDFGFQGNPSSSTTFQF
ncbi:hypothetical protein PHLCEN_2v868 [Hermanssonia centrifuga]|uniref:Uncharacterized protein n=1 Tax=Hermanssonia centrifuga TaxID=98765 RepID=A0A2R6S502_9APHY|nr:hypothetical protein PHLCEN_2v868 [Hermanssonia centrifuga]